MVYVDLNPIRAGIADTLEDSTYTSIQQRITEYTNRISVDKKEETSNVHDDAHLELSCFIGDDPDTTGIHYHLADYFELADWTAVKRNNRHDITEQNTVNTSILGLLLLRHDYFHW